MLTSTDSRPYHAVDLKIEIHEIHEIHQNFTKSSVYINQIPASATKSTYMNRKLSNPM